MAATVGVDLKAWVKIETTFDTVSAFAATDAFTPLEISFEPTKEYHKYKEHVGSATLQGEVAGKRGGRWSCKVYVKPTTAGTPPDFGVLMQAAMGSVSSSTYSLSAADANLSSLQIARYVGDTVYEVVTGAWVEEMQIEAAGNDEPVITFSGGFARMGWLYGAPTCKSNHASGTSVDIKDADLGQIGVNSLIKFGSEDNGGSGYTVTAVDNTSGSATMTITPTLAGAISQDDAITPVVPALTLAGTIQGGVDSDLQIDSTSVGCISYKLTLRTGIHGLDKEMTTDRANRIARGPRELEGEIEFYFLEENALYLGSALDGVVYDIDMRIGPSTANNKMTVSTNKARINVVPLNVPEAEEATWTGTFVPRKNAANEDELSIVFA